MIHLKVILYGILAFIERNPIFCLFLLLIGIFAPVVFKVVGWIILGIIALVLLGIAIFALRMRRMRREMEQKFQQGSGGTGFNYQAGGFSGFGNMNPNGMTLEELVRQMQAQADARKQHSGSSTQSSTNANSVGGDKGEKVGDYVDFEEVK